MKLIKLKIFSKITILVLTIFACCGASAEVVNLYCAGVMKGRGIADSPYDFDLVMDSKTGYMSGFPFGLSFGCFSVNAEKTNPMKCSIDDIEAICTCQNHGLQKIFTLSRRSATLIVEGSAFDKKGDLVEDMSMRGRFSCQKIKNKVF